MGDVADALNEVTDASDSMALAAAQIDGENIKIPPLGKDYQITVHAYATGKKVSDSSTADLSLYFDGIQVASRHDRDFDNYNFDIEHSLILPKGNVAHLRTARANFHADETSYGLEIRRVTPI